MGLCFEHVHHNRPPATKVYTLLVTLVAVDESQTSKMLQCIYNLWLIELSWLVVEHAAASHRLNICYCPVDKAQVRIDRQIENLWEAARMAASAAAALGREAAEAAQ